MPSMTITTTTQDAQNLAEAVGWHMGLNGSASSAQVKDYTIAQLKQAWRVYKHHIDQQAVPPPAEIAPT